LKVSTLRLESDHCGGLGGDSPGCIGRRSCLRMRWRGSRPCQETPWPKPCVRSRHRVMSASRPSSRRGAGRAGGAGAAGAVPDDAGDGDRPTGRLNRRALVVRRERGEDPA
jgi:hypothetical protein